MNLGTKMLFIVNVLYFVALLYLLLTGGAILGMVASIVGLLLFLLPVLIGLICSILFYKRKTKDKLKATMFENVLVMAPIANSIIVVAMIVAAYFAS